MATSSSPTHYVGPSPTGGYYYANPTTGDINELNIPPSPEQLNAWQTENPSVGSLAQTQSTPSQLLQPNTTIGGTPVFTEDQINKDLTTPIAANQRGVGAANDDSGIPSVSSINATLNAVSVGPIVAQPNVLDQYASYTYSLSLYVITPDQFNDLKNGPPNFADWTLLIQSGGALTTPSQTALGQRSPFFKLDYYLDNLTLVSQLPGGGPGTLAAHNVKELDFTILEPNGISLINNLVQAVQTLYKQAPAASSTNGATTTVPGQAGAGPTTTSGVPIQVSYMQTPYVMVIRFYGYDDQGNLLQAGNPSKAIVTKYYPFAISKIDFKLQSKAIEYKVTGKMLIYDLAPSAKRGSIPANINLVGKTINDILNGNNSAGMEVSPVDGRSSSSTPSVQKAPPAPAPKHDIQSTIGISGIHAGTPGADNQQQADTLNLLIAGNMGA